MTFDFCSETNDAVEHVVGDGYPNKFKKHDLGTKT